MGDGLTGWLTDVLAGGLVRRLAGGLTGGFIDGLVDRLGDGSFGVVRHFFPRWTTLAGEMDTLSNIK